MITGMTSDQRLSDLESQIKDLQRTISSINPSVVPISPNIGDMSTQTAANKKFYGTIYFERINLNSDAALSSPLLQLGSMGTGNRLFQFYVSGPGANYDTLYLAANTASGGTTFADRIVLQADGFVGIGVASPVAMLEICSGGNQWGTFGWGRAIQIQDSCVIKWKKGNSYAFGIGQTGDNLYFGRNTVDDTSAIMFYPMTIQGSTGFIGMGTSNPGRQLSIVDPTSGIGVEIASNIVANRSDIISYNRGSVAYKEMYFGASVFTFNNQVAGPAIGITGLNGYTANSYFYLGNYTSSRAYIQAPNGGQIEMWNSGTYAIAHFDNDGHCHNYQNVTTWDTTSDEKLKKDIVDYPNGLALLTQLKPKKFKFNIKHHTTSEDDLFIDGVGFIAQDVQPLLPEVVKTSTIKHLDKEDDEVLEFSGLGDHLQVMMVNAIQEISARLEKLEKKQ